MASIPFWWKKEKRQSGSVCPCSSLNIFYFYGFTSFSSTYFAFLHTPVGHSQREGPGTRLQRLRHTTADEHFRCDGLTSRNLLTPHCFLQGMWEKGNDSCSGHPISAASQLLPWLSHTHVTGMCSQMGSPAP